MDDIDTPGFRIIVPEKGVAQAKLSQTLKNVKLIGVPIAIGSANRVVEMLKNGEADATESSDDNHDGDQDNDS